MTPGNDRVPPDPADADRIPPADLYDAIPEPDPRDLSTVVDQPAGSPSDEEPPAVSPPDPAAETTAPPPDLAAAEQTVVVDRARAAVATAWDYFLHEAPRSWVPAYLASRGLDSDGVGLRTPGLGPAPSITSKPPDSPATSSPAAGLARTSNRGTLIDPFRNRLMLPIHDAEGRVVAFIGRAHPSADHSVPKYLNSPGTVLFRKSDLPYGRARDYRPPACRSGPGHRGRPTRRASGRTAARHIGNDLVVVADPKRVCIYGASYGGYATLAGLTQTPDLYACGVDYVGVANLFTFMQTIPPYWKPYLEMIHEMVGDPDRDKALLTAASPALNADKIKAPLLIAQGANDPRVNKDESDQMVAALKGRGIDVPYMVKDNEGHGFRNEENQFDFYAAMEKFLDQHIGKSAN